MAARDARTITIAQLATHTAGFPKNGGYLELQDTSVARRARPGPTRTAGLNWLADVLTDDLRQDLATLLNTRVWSVIGLRTPDDVRWRSMAQRFPRPDPRRPTRRCSTVSSRPASRRTSTPWRASDCSSCARAIGRSARAVRSVRPAGAHAAAGECGPDPLRSDQLPRALTNYGVLWWTNQSGQMTGVPDRYLLGMGSRRSAHCRHSEPGSRHRPQRRSGGRQLHARPARVERRLLERRCQCDPAVHQSDRRRHDALTPSNASTPTLPRFAGEGWEGAALLAHRNLQSVLLRLQCIRHCFDRHARRAFAIRIVLTLERELASVQLDLAHAATPLAD